MPAPAVWAVTVDGTAVDPVSPRRWTRTLNAPAQFEFATPAAFGFNHMWAPVTVAADGTSVFTGVITSADVDVAANTVTFTAQDLACLLPYRFAGVPTLMFGRDAFGGTAWPGDGIKDDTTGEEGTADSWAASIVSTPSLTGQAMHLHLGADDANLQQFAYRNAAAPAGQWVYVAAWRYIDGGTFVPSWKSTRLLYVELRDGSGNFLDNVTTTADISTATDVWVREEVSIFVPATATQLNVRLGAVGGDIYWDRYVSVSTDPVLDLSGMTQGAAAAQVVASAGVGLSASGGGGITMQSAVFHLSDWPIAGDVFNSVLQMSGGVDWYVDGTTMILGAGTVNTSGDIVAGTGQAAINVTGQVSAQAMATDVAVPYGGGSGPTREFGRSGGGSFQAVAQSGQSRTIGDLDDVAAWQVAARSQPTLGLAITCGGDYMFAVGPGDRVSVDVPSLSWSQTVRIVELDYDVMAHQVQVRPSLASTGSRRPGDLSVLQDLADRVRGLETSVGDPAPKPPVAQDVVFSFPGAIAAGDLSLKVRPTVNGRVKRVVLETKDPVVGDLSVIVGVGHFPWDGDTSDDTTPDGWWLATIPDGENLVSSAWLSVPAAAGETDIQAGIWRVGTSAADLTVVVSVG